MYSISVEINVKGRVMRSINPSSGMLINDYASHSTSETSKIITSTNETWIMWRKTSFQQRSRLMHNAASVLRNEKEDLARLMSLEMGKVLHEAAAEIEK